MTGRIGVLERFSLLHEADLDAMRDCVSRYLSPHRSEPLGHGGAGVRTDVAAASLGSLTLVYADHRGAELGVRLTEQVDYYDVNMSWGGHNRIVCGDDEVIVSPGTAGIISPHTKVAMHLSEDYRQMHVRIERFALERHLEGLLDRPIAAPLRFRPAMDLSLPAARSWEQAVRLLASDLDEPMGLGSTPTESNPWSSFLMTGLLLAQPHNYSEQLAARQERAHRPAPLKKAIDLIELEPESDLSIERLALAVGVSPRSLQRHFQEHVGVSPREFVMQVRLARVHDALRAATPGDGNTVADIALGCGFSHLGRFAAAYQQRYGVPPSVTLRS
ncbi:AraC family transcriptional regulator [Sinomonas sp. ASV322]|uniref:AraC family transcriptional regulator n=1 Tax=Sinomonas sp. ASV322 TaxID=3041920 RepID=UPI0027DC4EE4|nr:AraC family transcriptional regulator [Sinomonas sp. ASV322]MDQ4502476.1 AraC family transcriptional regulator [Sinomonas sp. ASV322]